MEDFKKALEGTLGRKHIDNIVDQVASFPDRFDALYTLTQHEETRIAWRATWACEKLSFLLPSLLMDKREELITGHAMPPRWNKTPATEYPSSSSCPEACQRSFLRFLPSRHAIFCRKRIRTSRLHETCLRHLPGRTGTDRRAESISGKYGTGILYGCSAMCPQQHPKKNKVMKILILNGSPRCQGLISRMLDSWPKKLAYVAPKWKQYPSINCRYAPVQDAWLAAAGRPVSYPKTMRSARFKRYNGQTC